MSRDLVKYIAESTYCNSYPNEQEDALVGWCLGLKKPRVLLSKPQDESNMHDEPFSGGGWSRSYSTDSIYIHRLKRSDWFLKAASHYAPKPFALDGWHWKRSTNDTIQ